MTFCYSSAVEKSDGNDEEDKYIIIKKILHVFFGHSGNLKLFDDDVVANWYFCYSGTKSLLSKKIARLLISSFFGYETFGVSAFETSN